MKNTCLAKCSKRLMRKSLSFSAKCISERTTSVKGNEMRLIDVDDRGKECLRTAH